MAGSEGPNASDSLALDSHASGPEEPVEPAGGPLQEPVPQEEGAADSEGGPKDSEAFALVPPSGALQLFSDRAMESLFKLSQEKGGPQKLSWAVLDSEDKVARYCQWLWHTFPEKDDVFYQGSKQFEVGIEVTDTMDMTQLGTETPAKSHVLALGFQAGTSLKPAPGNDTFQKLAGHHFSKMDLLQQQSPFL